MVQPLPQPIGQIRRAILDGAVPQVLERGQVRRLGEQTARRIHARVIATTNRVLAREVQAGRFRQDLYFRLAVLTVRIPALRERRGDVGLLAKTLLQRNHPGATLTAGAIKALEAYDWPGNIRELRNACERAVLLSQGPAIELHHLTITSDESLRRPQERFRRAQTVPGTFAAVVPNAADMPSQVRATVAELEKQRILEALERCAGNQTRAAELLGISRRTLINRLDEYGIARPRKRDE